MVEYDAFRRDLATSLLKCAERRRMSRAGGTLTGEDIKVLALLERLAEDVENLDLHVFLIFELMFTHKRHARRFLQRREDLFGQLGISYCPSDATDLVRWLTRLTMMDEQENRSPGSRWTSAVEVVPLPGGTSGSERRPLNREKHGLLRSCVSDISGGFGIVAPLLSLWYVRAALGQLHDRSFMADHAAVPATVVSVSAVTVGRSIASASDVVLAFRQPSGQACTATWHTGISAFSGAPGDTLAVVPRSTICELPLIPSQIGDPMQTFALAAALMAGGFASLKLWAWLFQRSPGAASRRVRHPARKTRHDLS